MAQYKTKDIQINAVQYSLQEWADNPLTFNELPEWLDNAIKDKRITPIFGCEDYWHLEVKSKNVTETCAPGDFIVTDGHDVFVIKSDLFKYIFSFKFDQIQKPRLDLSEAHRIVNSWPKWKRDLADRVLRPSQ